MFSVPLVAGWWMVFTGFVFPLKYCVWWVKFLQNEHHTTLLVAGSTVLIIAEFFTHAVVHFLAVDGARLGIPLLVYGIN